MPKCRPLVHGASQACVTTELAPLNSSSVSFLTKNSLPRYSTPVALGALRFLWPSCLRTLVRAALSTRNAIPADVYVASPSVTSFRPLPTCHLIIEAFPQNETSVPPLLLLLPLLLLFDCFLPVSPTRTGSPEVRRPCLACGWIFHQ